MRYEVSGRCEPDAATVLLSTGLGGFGAYWKPQLAALGMRYRVVTYDHNGVGANAGPLAEGYSIEDMAREVVAIMDDAAIDRVHFVGHALGGLVGLALALDAPERVASLVVVNAWAAVNSQTLRCFEARVALLRHVGVEAYVKAQPIFLYPAVWAAEREDDLAREGLHAVAHFQGEDTLLKRIAALKGFDVSRRLGGVAAPTLAIAARDDVLVPWTASKAIAGGVRSGRLVICDGAHACNAVFPDLFNAELLAFVGEHADV